MHTVAKISGCTLTVAAMPRRASEIRSELPKSPVLHRSEGLPPPFGNGAHEHREHVGAGRRVGNYCPRMLQLKKKGCPTAGASLRRPPEP